MGFMGTGGRRAAEHQEHNLPRASPEPGNADVQR